MLCEKCNVEVENRKELIARRAGNLYRTIESSTLEDIELSLDGFGSLMSILQKLMQINPNKLERN